MKTLFPSKHEKIFKKSSQLCLCYVLNFTIVEKGILQACKRKLYWFGKMRCIVCFALIHQLCSSCVVLILPPTRNHFLPQLLLKLDDKELVSLVPYLSALASNFMQKGSLDKDYGFELNHRRHSQTKRHRDLNPGLLDAKREWCLCAILSAESSYVQELCESFNDNFQFSLG